MNPPEAASSWSAMPHGRNDRRDVERASPVRFVPDAPLERCERGRRADEQGDGWGGGEHPRNVPFSLNQPPSAPSASAPIRMTSELSQSQSSTTTIEASAP